MWAVILAAVFSLLTSFGVLDTRNRLVWTIGDFLYRITEPALRPIRNLMPNLGGIDISPMDPDPAVSDRAPAAAVQNRCSDHLRSLEPLSI